MTSKASSPGCAEALPPPAPKNAGACCGCWSRTSSSDQRGSPSATASRSGNPPAAAAATTTQPTRRVTCAQIINCVGGVFSPVMCNVYLHRLDRAWQDGDGVLVRFADDLVVMCWSRSQAEQALQRLTDLLAGLGLEPRAAKTRIVHLEEGGGGFDFLGFHHRLVRSRGLNGNPGWPSWPGGPRTGAMSTAATASGT